MDEKEITQALKDIAESDASQADLWPAIQASIEEYQPQLYKKKKESNGMKSRSFVSFAAAVIFVVLGGLVVLIGFVSSGDSVGTASVGSATLEPTPTDVPPTSVPIPIYDINHPAAAQIVSDWFDRTALTPDAPLVSQTTVTINLDEEETAQEIRYWGNEVFVIVRTMPNGTLAEGEDIIIDGREARVVTGLSGEASRDIRSLQDGSGTLTELRGGGFNDIPATIVYTDATQIEWMQDDKVVSVTGNISFDVLLAFARFHMQDVDNSVWQPSDIIPIATTSNAERSPRWYGDTLLYVSSDAADNNEFVLMQVTAEGVTERGRSATGQTNAFPNWSPDGTRIIYTSLQNGVGNIFMMDTNLTTQSIIQLTNNSGYDGEPVWSPDGSQIAFFSDSGAERAVYVMNADGSNVQRITPPSEDYIYKSPQWSPDGSQLLVFRSTEQGEGGAVVVNPDGTDLRLVAERAFGAQWSPDGTQIVYNSNVEGQDEIYTVQVADPTNIVRITSHTATDYAPQWSPDGSHIAFVSDRGGDYDIYVISATGGIPVNVTQTAGDELFPMWSPDGLSIAYTYVDGRTLNTDIYIVNLSK